MSDYNDIIRQQFGGANPAGPAAIGNIDENPDQAARALQLSSATGVPAPAIYGDVDGFERQNKAALAGDIIRNNEHIRDYVNSNVMAPRLSNDDYGQLDSVSERVSKMSLPMRVLRMPEAISSGLFGGLSRGVPEGFGDGPIGSWIMGSPGGSDFVKNYPMSTALITSMASPIELGLRSLNAGIKGVTDAAAGAGEEGYRSVTGDENQARRFGREIGSVFEYLTTDPGAIAHGADATRSPVAKTVQKMEPYVDRGIEPPRGVDPSIDKWKAERNDFELGQLDDALADSQLSKTRERNPDMFADFVAQHTDAKIGLSADAVDALYGGKIPEPNDGLLGWVPDLKEQLDVARASGGDVHVPISDWLAKVDPAVAKALHDDTRVRPGGITAREVELTKDQVPADALAEPVPAARAAAALEPVYSIGDRKLALERIDPVKDWATARAKNDTGLEWDQLTPEQQKQYADASTSMYTKYGPEQGFHDFIMRDENGGDIGTLNLSLQKGGKQVYVDMITGINGLGPRDFGPRLMRDLLRQIKEQFPNAESITGHRVSGAREKAGSYMEKSAEPVIKFDQLDDLGVTDQLFRELLTGVHDGRWEDIGHGLHAFVKPEFRGAEAEMAKAVEDTLDRVTPQGVQASAVGSLYVAEGRNRHVNGVYQQFSNELPQILIALDSADPVGTARHEAIHHLRKDGFFLKEEWDTLTKAAETEGWREKFNIDRRYEGLHDYAKTEEAIADAYKDWANGAKTTPEVAGIFERLKAFFDQLREKFRQIIGRDASWDEIFQKVESGEVGSRYAIPRDDEVRSMKFSEADEGEHSRLFARANAIGMTVDQFRRYEKLIEARHAEDVAKTTERVEREQKRRQSAEWKANAAEVRKQVADDINLRPDVAADNFFADGILYGEKVERQKLGTDFLTDEQRAALPRDYYNKSGVHPDDLAGLFGFVDGASLVQHLSQLSEIRRQSGMRPIDFKRRLITMETDRVMEQRYGKLENNIYDATMDQVLSETQLNLLAEETLALAVKSGEVGPFDKAAVEGWVKDKFEASNVSNVKTDTFLRDAGKAGKAAEMHLLRGEFADAFREKQRQFYATSWAAEARALEKEQAKFAKLAKRLAPREVKGLDPEFLDMAQELLVGAGIPVKRSLREIQESKVAYGNESMPDFIARQSADGWDLAVSEDLAGGLVKPIDQMSVAEFRDLNDAITSINYVGREVRKIDIAGEKQEWADFRGTIIDNITQLPARDRAAQNKWIYKIDASLTRMEEMVKDLDLRKELGPLFQAVIEPMMKSKSKEFDLLTDLSKHFQETRGEFGKDWRRSLKDTIAQDVMHDPYTNAPYDMTRENLIQVMLNWGNESNINKLVNGAGLAKFGRRLTKEEAGAYRGQIKAMIDQHARPEDWQFVQRMWEPFKGWQKQMDTVARNTSGVTPKWVDVGQVETPHGTFDGGYWPVKYDRLGSNLEVIEDRKPSKDGVFTQDYFRAATSKGYLRERTGYTDFVDISTSLEQASGTMQQTIHDIAFRDALIQGSKVFYDKGIRAAIRKHYGAEYEQQLIPWLRRIASQYTIDDKAISGYNDFLRRVRINLVGHALPFNLKVILSPDVGVPDPKAWTSFYANRGENAALALEKSNEIRHLVYNMDRDYREALDKITADPTVGDLQKKAIQWGFQPIAKVSQEFRMSTFVDQYYKAIGRGKTDVEAAAIADSFVRERHGAASVVDLPSIMQSSEGMKMLTMFYGYFNTMYNWQRQLPGNVRRGEGREFAVNGLGSVVVGAAFGAALFNNRKQDDSWFKIIGKALLLQPLSTIPVINTAASYFAEGFSPRTPFASLLGAAGSIITDAKKIGKGQRLEKPITHGANIIGLSTGLPLAQIGRTAQFGADVANNRQKPRNIGEWARGIISGEARLKK